METKNLREFVSELKKGIFGITIVAETEPRMKKTDNPYFGRVTKRSTLRNVAIGYNYENVVNNRLEREAKGQLHFTAQKPNGKTWVKGLENLFLVADKDPKQMYLRTTMRKNTKAESAYYVDGRQATDAEVLAIKTFLPTSAKPTNQGLTEENAVIVRDYKVESIISITCGEKVYNRG